MEDQRELRLGRSHKNSLRRTRVRRPDRPAGPKSASPFRRARLPLVLVPRRSGPSRRNGIVAALAEVIRDAIAAERVNTIGSESDGMRDTIPPPDTTPADATICVRVPVTRRPW